MACIQCGKDVRVGNHGMCPSCARQAGKEAFDTLKNAPTSTKTGVAGAVAGAAIGSVVPIIGTTIGAIIGGFIGSALGSDD